MEPGVVNEIIVEARRAYKIEEVSTRGILITREIDESTPRKRTPIRVERPEGAAAASACSHPIATSDSAGPATRAALTSKPATGRRKRSYGESAGHMVARPSKLPPKDAHLNINLRRKDERDPTQTVGVRASVRWPLDRPISLLKEQLRHVWRQQFRGVIPNIKLCRMHHMANGRGCIPDDWTVGRLENDH